VKEDNISIYLFFITVSYAAVQLQHTHPSQPASTAASTLSVAEHATDASAWSDGQSVCSGAGTEASSIRPSTCSSYMGSHNNQASSQYRVAAAQSLKELRKFVTIAAAQLAAWDLMAAMFATLPWLSTAQVLASCASKPWPLHLARAHPTPSP
jgi:hypothetical protein